MMRFVPADTETLHTGAACLPGYTCGDSSPARPSAHAGREHRARRAMLLPGRWGRGRENRPKGQVAPAPGRLPPGKRACLGLGGGDHGTHGCTSENAEALSVSRPPRLQKGSIEKAVCPLMGNWASADATAGRDKHTGRNSWEVLPREAKVPSHHPRSTCSPPPNGRGGAVSRFQLWHQHTTFAFPNHFRTAGLSGYVPNTP